MECTIVSSFSLIPLRQAPAVISLPLPSSSCHLVAGGERNRLEPGGRVSVSALSWLKVSWSSKFWRLRPVIDWPLLWEAYGEVVCPHRSIWQTATAWFITGTKKIGALSFQSTLPVVWACLQGTHQPKDLSPPIAPSCGLLTCRPLDDFGIQTINWHGVAHL